MQALCDINSDISYKMMEHKHDNRLENLKGNCGNQKRKKNTSLLQMCIFFG